MMDKQYVAHTQSPVGLVEIRADDQYVRSVHLLKSGEEILPESNPADLPAHVRRCVVELGEYFDGTRRDFTVPVEQDGTDFQRKVWRQLLQIPYGTTVSYLELSKRLGNVKLTRAVGGANHRNRLWIVVPCHRVIGADGSLTGYGGGLECKQWLLRHEADNSKSTQ